MDDGTSVNWRGLAPDNARLCCELDYSSCVLCTQILLQVASPYCGQCDCGSAVLSYIYFVSFYILIVFIFVNVFIG